MKEAQSTTPMSILTSVPDVSSHRVESYALVKDNQVSTRPYIMAEYAHSMGNSNVTCKDYWDVIEKERTRILRGLYGAG